MDTIKNVYGKRSNLDMEKVMREYSKDDSLNLRTGEPWNGFKELTLVDRVEECEDIVSFYFKDKSGDKLVKHKAGQFLPLRIKTNDEKYSNAIRTYSLSMKPNEDIYRISVKRIEGGLISSYIHDNLNVGDSIEAMAPAGLFTLKEEDKNRPLVLMSAGIGITPLLSMLYESAKEFKEVIYVQAVQNSTLQPFNYDIKKICEMNGFKNYVFYSDPLEGEVAGKDYDFKGFISKEWIEENLPLNGAFYFCGPPPFMKSLNKSLISLGVDRKDIHFEFFGSPEAME